MARQVDLQERIKATNAKITNQQEWLAVLLARQNEVTQQIKVATSKLSSQMG